MVTPCGAETTIARRDDWLLFLMMFATSIKRWPEAKDEPPNFNTRIFTPLNPKSKKARNLNGHGLYKIVKFYTSADDHHPGEGGNGVNNNIATK